MPHSEHGGGIVSGRCWALRCDGQSCRAVPPRGQALCAVHKRLRQGVPVWGGPADGRTVRPVSDRVTLVQVARRPDGTHRVTFPDVELGPGERAVGWYRLEEPRSGLWRAGLRYRWYTHLADVAALTREGA